MHTTYAAAEARSFDSAYRSSICSGIKKPAIENLVAAGGYCLRAF